jgi:hypothetical protein
MMSEMPHKMGTIATRRPARTHAARLLAKTPEVSECG